MNPYPPVDKRYPEACVELTQALIDAISVSHAIRGIPTTNHDRRFWASVLLSRICLFGTSLLKISPQSVTNKNGNVWDFSSIATLARSIFECYLSVFYLCIDKVSKPEYEFRLILLDLHDCAARLKVLGKLDVEHDRDWFTEQLAALQDKLKENEIFMSCEPSKQRELLKGKTAHHLSQDEIVSRLGREEGKLFIRGFYEFLSAQVHSLPMSYYRTPMQPGRGTGRENLVEKEYTTFVLSFTAELVAKLAVEIKSIFPEVQNFPRCRVNWDNGECTPLTPSDLLIGSK